MNYDALREFVETTLLRANRACDKDRQWDSIRVTTLPNGIHIDKCTLLGESDRQDITYDENAEEGLRLQYWSDRTTPATVYCEKCGKSYNKYVVLNLVSYFPEHQCEFVAV